jgi:hypothetical protein
MGVRRGDKLRLVRPSCRGRTRVLEQYLVSAIAVEVGGLPIVVIDRKSSTAVV